MVQSTDWLARGGTYFVLAFVCLGSSVYFYYLGAKLGHQTGHPNDGCLYGVCNVILAFLGAGAGFLLLIHHYPYFILSSCIGAILLPTLGTLFCVGRAKSRA